MSLSKKTATLERTQMPRARCSFHYRHPEVDGYPGWGEVLFEAEIASTGKRGGPRTVTYRLCRKCAESFAKNHRLAPP